MIPDMKTPTWDYYDFYACNLEFLNDVIYKNS